MFMMGQENEFQTDVCKKSYFKKLIDLFTFVIENIFLSFYITKLPQKKRKHENESFTQCDHRSNVSHKFLTI